MKTTFFASQIIRKGEFENDYEFTLEYYLIVNSVKDYEKNKYTDCYGVEIIKKYSDAAGNELSQKSAVKNITTDKKAVYTLLRTIYNQKITPVCLCEVIDDCFNDNILDTLEA